MAHGVRWFLILVLYYAVLALSPGALSPLRIAGIVAPVLLCGGLLALWLLKRRTDRFEETVSVPRYELRVCDAAEFPRVDPEYYRDAQAELERLGFRRLGDVENMTLAKTIMNPHAPIRIMLSRDGMTVGSINHLVYSLPIRIFCRLALGFTQVKTVGFGVEAEDGRVFAVMNMPEKMVMPAGPADIVTLTLPTTLSPAETHAEFVRLFHEYLEDDPTFVPRRHETFTDVMNSEYRLEMLRACFLSKAEGISSAELVALGFTPEAAERILNTYGSDG